MEEKGSLVGIVCLDGKAHIETTVETAEEIEENIYRGVITGALYNKEGQILTRSTPLFTTVDAEELLRRDKKCT